MITFKKRVINPEYELRHIKDIKNFLERNVSSVLSGKAELGSRRSEWGYQLTAASISGMIARVIGFNEDKAKALSLAIGLYFPKYGQEGLKIIKQYIIEREMDLNIEVLGITTSCYYISEYYYQNTYPVIDSVFYDMISDYFNGVNSCNEIRIVRLVQDTIMDIKKAERFYEGYPGDLLNKVTNEMIELARKSGQLEKSSLMEKYKAKIDNYKFPELTEQERKDIYDKLDSYVEEFTNLPEGLESLKKTPEEAVLLYMYLEN